MPTHARTAISVYESCFLSGLIVHALIQNNVETEEKYKQDVCQLLLTGQSNNAKAVVSFLQPPVAMLFKERRKE